jgi:zinc transporter ZupT
MKSSSSVRLLLLAFLLIGMFLRVGAALRFPTVDSPDEVLETQEPGHHLAYGYGVVCWEWRQGARSWVFPAFLAGVMRTTDWMGPGSTGYRWGIVIVLSLLSLTTVWFGFAWARRASGMEAAIVAAGGCAIWYELVHFAPKALTEVVATNALLPGLYLGVYGERFQEKKRMFLAGIFCGLAMSLRIQLAPAVALAALYFCYPNWRKRILPLAAGLLLPVVGFGLVDAVTWSHPFQSFLVYYRVHARELAVSSLPSTDVVEGAHNIPLWYLYLRVLCAHLGPVGFLVLMGIRRSPLLGWVALIHLAFHSFYGAGEVRYLYPLVPLEITLAALGIMEFAPAFNARRKSPLSSRTIIVGGLAFLALSSCLLVPHFNWSRNSGTFAAFDQLSRDPTLCGVGIYRIGWWNIGGYTHLHQNVPIVLLQQASELEQEPRTFNAVVTPGSLSDPKDGFELAGCWNGYCLYRRPGPCTPLQGGNEINWVLWLNGS